MNLHIYILQGTKVQWLSYLGLGILIAINAIASGANLVIKPLPKKPSWEL